MNNNSKQSDLVGLLWSLDSRGWIIIFLESFLHLNIAFLNVYALHIWIQLTIHGANSCHRICRMSCLHMHFGVATWKNALNQYTLVTGPEQGAFYQSLHSVTLSNVKNRVGCMDISVWLGGFQGGLGSERESSSGPHSRRISPLFPRGKLLLPWSCLKCLHSSTSSSWSPVDYGHVFMLLMEHILLWWISISINLRENEFLNSL